MKNPRFTNIARHEFERKTGQKAIFAFPVVIALLASLIAVVTLTTAPHGTTAQVQAQVATPVIDRPLHAVTNVGSDSIYYRGETIQVQVTFSQEIAVTGTPRLALDIGGTEKNANCSVFGLPGAGDVVLLCEYTVQSGDSDTDGISIAANKLSLNGGTIKSKADSNVDADLSHSVLGDQSSHKVDGSSTAPPPPNTPPTFPTNRAVKIIEENYRFAYPVVAATDSDAGDSLTGYSLSGRDAALFEIINGNVLAFVNAPDFENPLDGGDPNDDTDGNNDNTYKLIVTATSGTGSRVMTATQDITVRVVDQSEPPNVPNPPIVTATQGAHGSLTVRWIAPDNTGKPSITRYELQLRRAAGSGERPDNWTQRYFVSGSARSLVITHRPRWNPDRTDQPLEHDVIYEVAIRAFNDETPRSGTHWSGAGTGRTSKEGNNPPNFTSSATFSVPENVVSVGTVVATDGDADDSITGYSLSGTDSRLSSITNAGVLTFRNAPDFENPGDANRDNVYEFTVFATSGTGDRSLRAFQDVTVTVTNLEGESDPTATPAPAATPTPTASTTPTAPQNFVLGPVSRIDLDIHRQECPAGIGSARASWDAPASNGGREIGRYHLQYRTGSTPDWSDIPGTDLPDLVNEHSPGSFSWRGNDPLPAYGLLEIYFLDGPVPLDIEELCLGQTYQMRVAAVNIVGTGPYSEMLSVTMSAPGAPGNVQLTPGDGEIVVTWDAPTTGGTPTSYTVEYRDRATAPEGEWNRLSSVTDPATTTATITGLDRGKTYDVRVRAINGIGDSDNSAVKSAEIPATRRLPGIFQFVLRIEPSIRSITISTGDLVKLSVNVYGRQDILDNDLAEGVDIDWDDGDAGGDFDGDDREVTYDAPDAPGTYTVTANIPHGDGCLSPRVEESEQDALARCTAEFEIRVRRPSVAPIPTPVPVNPPGPIPPTLTDSQGTAYAVFTPVEGGEFVGAGFGISAGPGVVPDGDYIGIAMVKTGLASNVGQPHHRYTLAGDSYDILAIDSAMQRVTGYALASPAEACIPLPDRLRPNISDVALAASDNSGSLTILASTVRVSVDGMAVCGNLSELPATIAAAKVGSPSDFLTTSPVPESELPDTGGSTPSSSRAMLWMLLIGIAALTIGATVTRARRRAYS